MKRFSASLLASIAILVTGGSAFGQVEQASHCDCDESGSYVGYQAADWTNNEICQTGYNNGGRRNRNDQCNDGRRGSRVGVANCLTTKAYPDSGWAPPTHYPVNYDGAWYGAYQPQAYYGSPGGGFVANYPAVYQPNDTTQLGYSYHKVPTWQSRPGMIPPVPRPGNFHSRGCQSGFCGNNGGGYYTGYGQNYIQSDSGACMHGDCNMNQTAYMSPHSGKVVRPAAKKSGMLNNIRFASLTDLFN